MKRQRSSRVIGSLIDRRLAGRERVHQGEVLRPVGFNKREVVIDKTCGATRLVSTLTPGESSAPGSLVPVLGVQGGSGLVAAESTIRGATVGSEAQGRTLPAALESVPPMLAAYHVSGGVAEAFVLKVGWRDTSGVFRVLHDGLTFGDADTHHGGLWKGWTVIYGDSQVPDGSFAVLSEDIANDHFDIYIADIGAGTVATVNLLPGPTPSRSTALEAEVHWDPVAKLLYVATVVSVTGPPTRQRRIFVWSVTTAGVVTQLHDYTDPSTARSFLAFGFTGTSVIAPYGDGNSSESTGGFGTFGYAGSQVINDELRTIGEEVIGFQSPLPAGNGYWVEELTGSGEDLRLARISDDQQPQSMGWTAAIDWDYGPASNGGPFYLGPQVTPEGKIWCWPVKEGGASESGYILTPINTPPTLADIVVTQTSPGLVPLSGDDDGNFPSLDLLAPLPFGWSPP